MPSPCRVLQRVMRTCCGNVTGVAPTVVHNARQSLNSKIGVVASSMGERVLSGIGSKGKYRREHEGESSMCSCRAQWPQRLHVVHESLRGFRFRTRW